MNLATAIDLAHKHRFILCPKGESGWEVQCVRTAYNQETCLHPDLVTAIVMALTEIGENQRFYILLSPVEQEPEGYRVYDWETPKDGSVTKDVTKEMAQKICDVLNEVYDPKHTSSP